MPLPADRTRVHGRRQGLHDRARDRTRHPHDVVITIRRKRTRGGQSLNLSDIVRRMEANAGHSRIAVRAVTRSHHRSQSTQLALPLTTDPMPTEGHHEPRPFRIGDRVRSGAQETPA